jgi:H+/Cl- antiporter ClcA
VWPDGEQSYLLIGVAVLLAAPALGVGLLFNRLMDRARRPAARASWRLIPAIAAAGLLTGVCSLWWPELPGNGKSVLTVSLDRGLTVGTALAVLVLKPLLTAAFLRAGAVGGLLTPALATGSAMGAALALAVNTWTGLTVSIAAVSLTCAAAVLTVTQRSPIWAAIFVWELARPPWWLLLVFVAGALAADGSARLVRRRTRRRRAATEVARPAKQ